MRDFVRTPLRATVIMTAAMALALTVGPTAVAEEPDGSPGESEMTWLTDEELDEIYPGASAFLTTDNIVLALRGLEAAPIPRTAAGLASNTYTFGGARLTLPTAASFETRSTLATTRLLPGMRGAAPSVSYRYSRGRSAFGFSTLEQQLLASGATAAMVSAVCLIPAVGWIACTLIGIVVAVATTFVTRNGICSGGRRLWWYDVRGGSVLQCRYSAPF